ncbi:retinal-binding protein-like, partial [Stegodyphus dumicola]|uniref:retinal-binding protein-like n=1 Tax=Stegodyphus dumicola TaxID=202533 RepID=UPI0015AEF42B
VNHGDLVPESYYIHKSRKSLAQAEGVKKITLSRGSYSQVTVEVQKCGSLIEWEYETNSRDIKFGLLFQEMGINGKNVIELVPTQKIDTNDYPQTGMYKCGKVGTYLILFDNSYSWIRSKRIYYRVKVVPPEDQEISIVD